MKNMGGVMVNQPSAQGASQGMQLGSLPIPFCHRSPVRPIAVGDPGCNNAFGARNLLQPGKQLRSTRCLTGVRGHGCGKSSTPSRFASRAWVDLRVDPSRVVQISIQVIDAEKLRVGKAGSVRMG